MMRTGYQQKERSKEDVIIEAATRLFLSKGFSGVSMEEIAKGSSVANAKIHG